MCSSTLQEREPGHVASTGPCQHRPLTSQTVQERQRLVAHLPTWTPPASTPCAWLTPPLAGIGAFLAFLGLQTDNGIGLVTFDSATLVTLGGKSRLAVSLCIATRQGDCHARGACCWVNSAHSKAPTMAGGTSSRIPKQAACHTGTFMGQGLGGG